MLKPQQPVGITRVRPCPLRIWQHRPREFIMVGPRDTVLVRDVLDAYLVVGGIAVPHNGVDGDARHLGRRDPDRGAELQPGGAEDFGAARWQLPRPF